jgi:DNA modification methylase
MTIITGNCLDKLKELPEKSVSCVVTSPPYWGLRDYGTAKWKGGYPNCSHQYGRNTRGGLAGKQNSNKGSFGDEAIKCGEKCLKCGAKRIDEQLGLEKTPEEYVNHLVEMFREVKRVLRDDGTVWLNLGDSYNKDKGLVGIPWRVAFALQKDGWYLRQDIIWSKPNPMPESVKDRCTKAHEYIFMLSKEARYYYDSESIKEPLAHGTHLRYHKQKNILKNQKGSLVAHAGKKSNGPMKPAISGEKRNKRSVWTVTTKPYKEAHFATFPPDLIEPCIKAGCPKEGVVLDPFGGSGTVGEVAQNLQRNFILIELNPEYVELAERRLHKLI